MGEHFCLKWNNHQENLTGIMTKLLDEQKFVDVSLVCEMKTFKAHQTVLSACSPYFEQVLEENPHPHPLIILRDVKESEMSALLQYMYRGEVNVRDDELSAFLHTARALQVRGLSDNKKDTREEGQQSMAASSSTIAQSVTVNPPKRRRPSTSTSELPAPERLLLDCQQPMPSYNKSSPKPSSSSTAPGPISILSNYSENSSDVHYADTSGGGASIKQEMDPSSATPDEPYVMPHHLVTRSSYTELQPSVTSATFLSSSSCAADTASVAETDNLEGSKQWHIKYAFEKVEGEGFKCRICGQIKKHVRNHYLKHFPEHHECHLCRRTYTRKDNLNSHLKRDHFQLARPPRDPYHHLKKFSKKLDDCQTLKCFTPDVYSHVKYSGGSVGTLNSHGSSLQSQPSPVSSMPMDLSLRPCSVPNPTPCAPIYDILYNYFRT